MGQNVGHEDEQLVTWTQIYINNLFFFVKFFVINQFMDSINQTVPEQPLAAATPKKTSHFKKFTRILLILLLLGIALFIYFKYFFVFGEGVKSGHLNYAVKKGNIFKTYEGKLIQEGYRSKTAGMIQSYEFEFSIKSKKIYDILAANSGKRFDLHYKEYHGMIPWRGNTKYIVDSIVSMRAD